MMHISLYFAASIVFIYYKITFCPYVLTTDSLMHLIYNDAYMIHKGDIYFHCLT